MSARSVGCRRQAASLGLGFWGDGGGNEIPAAFGAGTRMLVPQARHRTVLPRQLCGTISTLRQVRLGHMMLMLDSVSLGTIQSSPRLHTVHRPIGAAPSSPRAGLRDREGDEAVLRGALRRSRQTMGLPLPEAGASFAFRQ